MKELVAFGINMEEPTLVRWNSMCLGIPGKIVELRKEENIAIVDYGGVKKEARTNLLDDVSVGDYVLVHAGYAIQKLDPKEAEETLKIFEEILSKFQ